MAQTYTINGVDYTFPDVDDSDWGQNVTDWAGAVSSFLLQRTGGTFTLSAEIDFGSSYGLLVKDLSSKTANPASAGFMQLASTDVVAWRNNANSGDINLSKGTDDKLEFNSIDLVDVSTAQTLTNKTLTSPVISGATLDGMTAIVFEGATPDDFETTLTVTDPTADRTWTIPDATDTAVGKATTDTLTNKTLTSPKMNEDVAMTTTSTYLNRMDATSSVQTQLDAKQATITGAATTITGADLSTSKVLQSNGSGKVEASSVTTTTLGYLDASSSIQTQIDSKQATITGAATTITGADLATSKVLQSNGSGKVEASSVTTTTLGYLDASSSVQTQLDAKAALSNPNFTGYADFNTISAPGAPGTSGQTRLYSTAGKLYFHGNGGSETEIGAGGGGAGDADTIQLKTAEASEGTGSAPWYTGNNPVPGGGGSIGGTWELSTSNPLINTNDATKVFHYSNATSDRKGDYFEIELDVPNYAKGHNLVVQLFYRTVGAEDTDFLFFARDRTADYETTTTSTGAQTTITLADDTGFAVGDRICLQDSSEARHFRYVTAVNTVSSTITFSGSAITFASGDAVVSKFFTDELNFITAENNTTNYEGKIRKWAFQINDTTTKIRVGFLYDNSATSTNELFFDQILLSSNQFLQTSSQGLPEFYGTFGEVDAFWDSSSAATTSWDITSLSPGMNTPLLANSKLLSITDISTDTVIEAKQDIKLDISFGGLPTTSEYMYIQEYGGTGSGILAETMMGATGIGWKYLTTTVMMSKGDQIKLYRGIPGGTYDNGSMNLCATPQANDVVLLNSQDEIFTDWVSYTPTYVGLGDVTTNKGVWRRDGSNMEIMLQMTVGVVTGTACYFTLPSGYNIDPKTLETSFNQMCMVGKFTYNTTSAYDGFVMVQSDAGYEDRCWLTITSGSYNPFVTRGGNQVFPNSTDVTIRATIPIQGWTSAFNPVLSMPLVNIGNDMEEFLAFQMAAPLAQYAAFGWDEVQKDTTGSLLSIANASTALIATAQQRCLVHISWTQSADGAVWNYIVKNGTSGTNPQSLTYGTSTNSQAAYTGGGGEAQNIKGVWILEPGDTIYTASSGTGFYDSSYRSNLSIVAVRDRGNTNMAHIIKPAVCILKNYVDASVSQSGGTMSSANTWYQTPLNVIEGESWFVTLSGTGTTGVAGSNINFTLDPGAYEITGVMPFVGYPQLYSWARFYDVTNSKEVGPPTSSLYNDAALWDDDHLTVNNVITITAATKYQFEAAVGPTSPSSLYMGYTGNSDTLSPTPYLAQVKIRKLK